MASKKKEGKKEPEHEPSDFKGRDSTKRKKAYLLDALEASKGVIKPACKYVGISRRTYHNWVKDDEEFKAQAEEKSEELIDLGESKLAEKVEEGDATSIIFLLKTKGKYRGYGEHQTIDLQNETINITYDKEDEPPGDEKPKEGPPPKEEGEE
jgi:hypothetical protein